MRSMVQEKIDAKQALNCRPLTSFGHQVEKLSEAKEDMEATMTDFDALFVPAQKKRKALGDESQGKPQRAKK